MQPQTRNCTLDALRHFERLVKPRFVHAIKTGMIDDFKARRRLEPGKKAGAP